MRKVELYELIRRERADLNWGIRRLAREHGCHRREVRQALRSAVPPLPKVRVRSQPVLGPLKGRIDAILEEDKKAPRKQRHTARRIWKRLRDEDGARVAETTVREYVRERRRELRVPEVMVPQVHEPGDEGEVDLYVAAVDFPWGRQDVDFFEMRACHSTRSFHHPLQHVTQQAFLEAHGEGFSHFGGVFRVLRYDNLSQAVRKVLRGRNRLQSEQFVMMRSHYLFEAVFCRSGIDGAHEKGGVEGGVGYFRRNHLVPVPRVNSWDELIAFCRAGMMAELDHRPEGHTGSVREEWEQERPRLRPLPDVPFDARMYWDCRVDPKGRVTVLRNRYSVPVGLVGRTIDVGLSSTTVSAYAGGREVARHERLYGAGHDWLELDHYLEVLRYKPGALIGSLALHQARARGTFPASYWELLTQLRRRHGESEGSRQMVDILFLCRDHGADLVTTAIEQAVECGAYDHGSVALFVRTLGGRERPTPPPLDEIGGIRNPVVPTPSIDNYDQLLGGTA